MAQTAARRRKRPLPNSRPRGVCLIIGNRGEKNNNRQCTVRGENVVNRRRLPIEKLIEQTQAPVLLSYQVHGLLRSAIRHASPAGRSVVGGRSVQRPGNRTGSIFAEDITMKRALAGVICLFAAVAFTTTAARSQEKTESARGGTLTSDKLDS